METEMNSLKESLNKLNLKEKEIKNQFKNQLEDVQEEIKDVRDRINELNRTKDKKSDLKLIEDYCKILEQETVLFYPPQLTCYGHALPAFGIEGQTYCLDIEGFPVVDKNPYGLYNDTFDISKMVIRQIPEPKNELEKYLHPYILKTFQSCCSFPIHFEFYTESFDEGYGYRIRPCSNSSIHRLPFWFNGTTAGFRVYYLHP